MYNYFMELQQIIYIMKAHQTDLSRFEVNSIAVFGSVARGDAKKSSDLDLLVEFSQPVGLFNFIRLKKYLEDLTHCSVDLVTPDALRPEMRNSILSEAVYVR